MFAKSRSIEAPGSTHDGLAAGNSIYAIANPATNTSKFVPSGEYADTTSTFDAALDNTSDPPVFFVPAGHDT